MSANPTTSTSFSLAAVTDVKRGHTADWEITYNGRAVIKYHNLPASQTRPDNQNQVDIMCQTTNREKDLLPTNRLTVILLKTPAPAGTVTNTDDGEIIYSAYLADDTNPNSYKVCSGLYDFDIPSDQAHLEMHVYDASNPLSPQEVDYRLLSETHSYEQYLDNYDVIEAFLRAFQPILQAYFKYISETAGTSVAFDEFENHLINEVLVDLQISDDDTATDYLIYNYPELKPFLTGVYMDSGFTKHPEEDRKAVLEYDSHQQHKIIIDTAGEKWPESKEIVRITFRYPQGDVVIDRDGNDSFRGMPENNPSPLREAMEITIGVLENMGETIPNVNATYQRYTDRVTRGVRGAKKLSPRTSINNLYLLQQTLNILEGKQEVPDVQIIGLGVNRRKIIRNTLYDSKELCLAILARFDTAQADKLPKLSLQEIMFQLDIQPYPLEVLDAYLEVKGLLSTAN